MEDFRKILVIKPSSFGDVIHSLPFLKSLSEGYPGAKIHWVISEGLYSLLEGHPLIDKLWPIDKDKWKKPSNAVSTIKEIKSLAAGLKAEGFDLTIDLQGLFRSGLITFLSGAPKRVGFKEAREGSTLFYTTRIKGGKNVHSVDRYLKVAAALHCSTENPSFILPEAQAGEVLPNLHDYAVMVPGARWETKRWDAVNFGLIAKLLPFPSVVVGGAEDFALGETVVAHSEGNAVNLAGKTSFRELVGVVRNAKFMLTNDTGPMHVAAAVGTPVFAIFGPTEPALTGPYDAHPPLSEGAGSSEGSPNSTQAGKRPVTRHRIITAGLNCIPCFKKKCSTKNCMRDLSFQSVYEIICQTL